MFAGKSVITAILITLFYWVPAQKNTPPVVDSAIAVAAKQNGNNAVFVKTCFFIADEYMNIEQYDAAQLWLNKIHAVLPVKTASLENYFLLSRQAEVYYYNNLQQLGLRESRRGLAMAQALNDSLLLADSYNFLGLFYMNIDSAAASVKYYKTGLLFTKPQPYPSYYISLSKPHHLHGNLAEAYYKLKENDSALLHYRLSLQKASAIQWQRGIAVACSGLGDVFFAQRNIDSSFYYYKNGAHLAQQSSDVDVALICFGGKANCFNAAGNKAAAFTQLDTGFALLKNIPNINRFYALSFLNTAVDIYKKTNNTNALINALEIQAAIERKNIASNNSQVQTILNAGMENEKRLLSLQVTAAERKQELANTRLMMALAGIVLLMISFLVYRYYQNQKLAVSKIRQKISQDLHDDIGASLSSLQIYGTIAEQSVQTNPAKAVDMLQKINRQSKEVQENMNDIVWSMNVTKSSAVSLEIKVKNYAAELLQDRNISFAYDVAPAAEAQLQNMQARKNILLIIKEALNNIAKHSEATAASLGLTIQDKNIILTITDNGTGFNAAANVKGNGLGNMKARVRELNGRIQFVTAAGNGVKIMIHIPLAIASSTR